MPRKATLPPFPLELVRCRLAVIDPETGLRSKRCSHCGELWPLTLDFYHLMRKAGCPIRWQTWCRACIAEWARARTGRADVSEGGGQ
jgi:hypothetical protein